jgi:hypothetical protein
MLHTKHSSMTISCDKHPLANMDLRVCLTPIHVRVGQDGDFDWVTTSKTESKSRETSSNRLGEWLTMDGMLTAEGWSPVNKDPIGTHRAMFKTMVGTVVLKRCRYVKSVMGTMVARPVLFASIVCIAICTYSASNKHRLPHHRLDLVVYVPLSRIRTLANEPTFVPRPSWMFARSSAKVVELGHHLQCLQHRCIFVFPAIELHM